MNDCDTSNSLGNVVVFGYICSNREFLNLKFEF